MGLFGKSKKQKIAEHVAKDVLQYYEKWSEMNAKHIEDNPTMFKLDTLYMTTRSYIAQAYAQYSPDQREVAYDECKEKFRQHIKSSSTIGLVDVCTIAHGVSMGLQETYIATMNRYIQVLYKLDIPRWEIEGDVYGEEHLRVVRW